MFLKDYIENYEDRKKILTKINDIDTIQNYEKKFLMFLKFEAHSLKFQIIETLFSFMFALEKGDDIDLWFNLTFPKNISERSFAVYDKISEFDNQWKLEDYLKKEIELNEKIIPYWKYVFFYDTDLSLCGVEDNIIEKNIINLLYQMARTFADREDYNHYKHALRCFSTSLSLSIIPDNTKKAIPIGFAKNGMNFLTRNEKEDDIVINTTFKAFSPKEDFYYIQEAMKLLKNIINVRRPHFCDEKSDDIYFFKEEKDQYYISDDYTLPGFSRSTTSLNTILSQAAQYYRQDDFNTAMVFFEKVLQIDNTNESAILGIGYCHFKLKNFDDAIKFFKKYTRNNRAEYWKRAQYQLASCYFSIDDLNLVEIELTKLINQYSEDIDNILTNARYFLADIKLRLNQQYFDEYGRNNMKYIKVASKLLKKAEENRFEYPEIWFKLALVRNYLGHFEQAKELYEKLNLHYPDNVATKLNLARIAMEIEDDLVYTENLLEECLLLDPKNFRTWVGISVLKLKQRDMDGYYKACVKALDLSSNPEEKKVAYNNLGDYHRKIDDYEKAIEYFQKSLEIDNNFENSIQGYIECLFKFKKYDKVEEFTNDFEYNELNKYPLKARAYALSHQNKHEEALEVINKCIEKYVDDLKFLSDLYDSKGDLLVRNGDITGGLDYYQKSLETGDMNYEFTVETKEKLKKYKSKLK